MKILEPGRLTLAVGTNCTSVNGSIALCEDAVASGIGALAVGLGNGGVTTTRAEGDGSVAVGLDVVCEQTYCVGMGAHILCRAAACVGIGENLIVGGVGGGSGQNAVAIGFNCTVTGTYAAAIGTSCYAYGRGAFACGLNSAADRAGEFSHGSGHSSYQGGKGIDLLIKAVAAAANVVMTDGNEFSTFSNTLLVMTARITAANVGVSQYAAEDWTFLVATGGGGASIAGSVTKVPVGVSLASAGTAGWTVDLTVPAGTTLRFACNPGVDTVTFAVRLSWTTLTPA